jgi:hypothetical protein
MDMRPLEYIVIAIVVAAPASISSCTCTRTLTRTRRATWDPAQPSRHARPCRLVGLANPPARFEGRPLVAYTLVKAFHHLPLMRLPRYLRSLSTKYILEPNKPAAVTTQIHPQVTSPPTIFIAPHTKQTR